MSLDTLRAMRKFDPAFPLEHARVGHTSLFEVTAVMEYLEARSKRAKRSSQNRPITTDQMGGSCRK